MKATCLACALLLTGCGSGLIGLNDNSNGNGYGANFSLVAMYYGSDSTASFTDSVSSSASNYTNATTGWSSPTSDTNDLQAFNSPGGLVEPSLFSSSTATSFVRIDLIFDANAGAVASVPDGPLNFELNGQGGCSNSTSGETPNTTSLSSNGGAWTVFIWAPTLGSWQSYGVPPNSLTAQQGGEGNLINRSAATTALGGIGGTGNYIIVSLRTNFASCATATGILLQSFTLSVQ